MKTSLKYSVNLLIDGRWFKVASFDRNPSSTIVRLICSEYSCVAAWCVRYCGNIIRFDY